MSKVPKVFISYSWSSPRHEGWVVDLAERLVLDGVDVVFDKWNLKEGQDKFSFMESMVRSPDIDRVLILLDRKYKEKAEQREGGVGTETQIISPKIYSDVSQEKFIPIVCEKDEMGNAFIPIYLEGRIYIDLSDDHSFERNYEALLRNIYNRPAYSKPKLGKAPGYLFEEKQNIQNTSIIVRSFDNQVNQNPQRINALVREFLDEFFRNLKGFHVSIDIRDQYASGKIIHDNIVSYTPLRNDYIAFLDKLLKSGMAFDIDNIIRFFERLPNLQYPQDDRSSWSTAEFDNFRFFIHELFLYTIAAGLKNETYKFVEELLYSTYLIRDRSRTENENLRFDKFYMYVESIDRFYKETRSSHLFSPMADLIMTRVPDESYKHRITEADLLCYYIALLEDLDWFPITFVYRHRESFDLIERLISMRHFERVKTVFNVSTVDELKGKLEAHKNREKATGKRNFMGIRRGIPSIYELVEIDKIGTIR